MKYIKRIFLFLILLIFFLHSNLVVFGTGTNYKENKNLYDDAYEQIIDAIKNYKFLYNNGFLNDKENPDNDIKFAYKIYPFVGAAYNVNETPFNKMIGYPEYWVLVTEKGKIRCTAESPDDYATITHRSMAENCCIDFIVVENALKSLGSDFTDENLTVKCVYFPPYYGIADIVYINLSGEEYFMHFSNNPQIVGLENGKLYKIETLIKIIDKVNKRVAKNNEDTIIYDEHSNDGGEQQFDYLPWIIGGISVLIIVIITGFILVKKRKNVNQGESSVTEYD